MHRPLHPRHKASSRAQKREGAVLLIVLMVVIMSTLAATFAVHDTNYELQGSRGVQQATRARYTAESGLHTTPSLVNAMGPGTFRAMLTTNAPTQGPSFPNTRYNIPPPVGAAFWAGPHDEVALMAYSDLDTSVEPILQDPRSPYQSRYAAIYESYCNTNLLHVTVSVHGRETFDPDLEHNDLTDTGDWADEYHDTVSLARAYFTAPVANGCGGGSR